MIEITFAALLVGWLACKIISRHHQRSRSRQLLRDLHESISLTREDR